MYVKVYSQILESSIAVDYQQRHIFQDLLIIADREGIIDMTHEAIARRLNVPEQLIVEKIAKLEQPDPKSRSEEHEGRRLLRLADHRDWGWRVVNYTFYRDLIDAEALRAANRERKREQRARERARHEMSQSVRDESQESQNVTPSESYSVSETKEEKSSCNGSGEPLPAAHRKVVRSPMMNGKALEELKQIPAYQGIDLDKEAWKFKTWCETNNKTQSRKRFVNWLNRVS